MKRIVLFLLLFICIFFVSQIQLRATELTITERIESRTENSKTFYSDDGAKTVFYNHDVHFFENGSYTEIDMSLIRYRNTYQTKRSNYQISLPDTLGNGDLIEVQHGESSLKFYYPDTIESHPSIKNNLGSEGLEKAQSQIKYPNVKNNTDLVLDLSPTQLKESFVLYDHAKDFQIDFYLILDNLSLTVTEDSSFNFLNLSNEVIFQFEPYFMYDSEDAYTDDVKVLYQEIFNGFYRFQVKPNQEWLSSSERVYPVIIDPIVNFKMNSSNQFMQDKYCYQGLSTCMDDSYLKVQYDDLFFVEPLDETLVFSLLELDTDRVYDQIMDIYGNSNYTSIDDIKMKLHLKDNYTPSSGILAQSVSSPTSYEMMDGLSSYTFEHMDVLSGSGSYYEFSIAYEIYHHHYIEEDLILRLYPTQPLVRYSTRFYASNTSNSTYQPSIEVEMGDWFVSDTRTNVNCYAFVLGLSEARDPGYFAGNSSENYSSLDSLSHRVKSDLDILSISYREVSGFDSVIYSNEYIIGMRIGYDPYAWHPETYHFIMRHYNRGWESKNGESPSTFFVPQNVDPIHVIWDLRNPPGENSYDVYFGDVKYLAIEVEP